MSDRSDAMRGRRRAGTWLVVIAAVLSTPAAAAAQSSAMVAVQPSGTAHAAWVDDFALQERRRSPLGVLGEAQWVTPAYVIASTPAMSVDAAGNAYFVWCQLVDGTSTVRARRRSADGTLHAIQTLSSPGQDATRPAVAADPGGGAIFAWEEKSARGRVVQLRRRTPAGALTATQTLSTDGYYAAEPALAVDGAGNAMVAWRRRTSPDRGTVVQARHRATDGTLSALMNLSTSGTVATPRVAVDGSGNAVVAWVRFDGSHHRLQTRRRAQDGTLSITQNLSPAGEHAVDIDLTMDPDGDAFVTWLASSPDAGHAVKLRRRGPDGSLSTVQSLAVPTGGVYHWGPDAAADPAGNVVVTWYRSAPEGTIVQVRRRATGGALSPIQDLSAAGYDGVEPVIGVDRNGYATVAWKQQAAPGSAHNAVVIRRRTPAGELSDVQTLSG